MREKFPMFAQTMTLIWLPLLFTVVESLRNVKLDIPTAVEPGETVTMICTYDLEGDDLYSVKWYKGKHEFYRYLPKEHPHIKVFPLLQIDVDISRSGANNVVLRDIHRDLSGKYKCEVSTDSPHFHTQVVVAHMHIVEAPSGKPTLRLEKTHYGVGETIRGNCSSPISSPASNITWLVNNEKINSSFESIAQIQSNESSEPVRYINTAGIEYIITSFQNGKLRLNCTADVHKVFSVSNEVLIEEERPKLASIMGSQGTSTGMLNSIKYTSTSLWVSTVMYWTVRNLR